MLKRFREKRAKDVVAHVALGVVDGVQTLPPDERAATYAVAHAILRAAADEWGGDVVVRPAALASERAATIVGVLAADHAKILDEHVVPLRERGVDDASYAQAKRQMRAIECVVGLIGRRWLGKAGAKEVMDAWRLLWQARVHVVEAADMLVRYAEIAKVDAIPGPKGADGRRQRVTREAIVELITTLPPCLRKAPSAPVQGGVAPRPKQPAPPAGSPGRRGATQ